MGGCQQYKIDHCRRAERKPTCAGTRRLWWLSVMGCPSAAVLGCRLAAWHGQDFVVPTSSTLSAAQKSEPVWLDAPALRRFEKRHGFG
jgi:hypothetical protein